MMGMGTGMMGNRDGLGADGSIESSGSKHAVKSVWWPAGPRLPRPAIIWSIQPIISTGANNPALDFLHTIVSRSQEQLQGARLEEVGYNRQ